MSKRSSETRRSGISAEEILAAATEAFSRQGYRGTNLQDVADVLGGVTRQAIYYYYPSKHEILFSLFQRFFDDIDAAITAAQESETEPAARFEMMLRAHLSVVARAPELSSIFTREYESLEPEAQSLVSERRRRHHRAFVEAYDLARESGRVRDLPSDMTVSLLLGAANWTFRWYPRRRDDLTVDELADAALSLFGQGYRDGRAAAAQPLP